MQLQQFTLSSNYIFNLLQLQPNKENYVLKGIDRKLTLANRINPTEGQIIFRFRLANFNWQLFNF